jgi:hypothetical protein
LLKVLKSISEIGFVGEHMVPGFWLSYTMDGMTVWGSRFPIRLMSRTKERVLLNGEASVESPFEQFKFNASHSVLGGFRRLCNYEQKTKDGSGKKSVAFKIESANWGAGYEENICLQEAEIDVTRLENTKGGK